MRVLNQILARGISFIIRYSLYEICNWDANFCHKQASWKIAGPLAKKRDTVYFRHIQINRDTKELNTNNNEFNKAE